MKLLIAADMEGISGVTSPGHTRPVDGEYARFRSRMTADVNAAVEGALQGGAQEIVVADGHLDGRNILIEELHPRARLNAGLAAPYAMVEGIQHDVDAAFFIGYHARMGSLAAVLDHTWSGAKIANVWLNGRLAGETALNAAVCGHYGAPVLMVSGDQALAEEAESWVHGIETAVVKQATGSASAECLPVSTAYELIRSTAERAVERHLRREGPLPLEVKTPVTLTIEFLASALADSAGIFPGVRRLDGRRLEVVMPNVPAAYSALRALATLA